MYLQGKTVSTIAMGFSHGKAHLISTAASLALTLALICMTHLLCYSLTITIITEEQIRWLFEPRHEKTNVLVSDLVRHKLGCTATEDV